MTSTSHRPSRDPASAEVRASGRMTALFCLTVAAIVLLDLVSQYVLAVIPAHPGSVVWRATSAQVITTQVSPLVIVALLSIVGSRVGSFDTRRWGGALVIVSLLFASATVVVLLDAPVALEHTDLRDPEAFRRASVRALGAGTLGAVAMLAAGLVLLRQRDP